MMSARGCKTMTLASGKPTPDSEFLPGFDAVVEALGSEWAFGTDTPGRVDGFSPNSRIWNVLREVELWHGLAGHTAGSVDGHQKLAVWMSLIEHTIEPNGGFNG